MSTHYKLLAEGDAQILASLFGSLGALTVKPPKSITPEDLHDVDILLVRSTTQVNELLLRNHHPHIIGSMVTGTDHIDVPFLTDNQIPIITGAGGNARSVAEYVFHALFYWFLHHAPQRIDRLSDVHLGIIGYGNIGTQIAQIANGLGITCFINDPPLEAYGHHPFLVPLDDLMSCHAITVHVPLTKETQHPTYHLIDHPFLEALQKDTLIINTSRGGVVDENALLDIQFDKKLTYVADVFEQEPFYNPAIVSASMLATPHIAGHSYEGKIMGMLIVYSKLMEFLKIGRSYESTTVFNEMQQQTEWHIPYWMDSEFGGDHPYDLSVEKQTDFHTFRIMERTYSIKKDDAFLRSCLNLNETERAKAFQAYRNKYLIRREFSHYILTGMDLNSPLISRLHTLGFILK